MMKATNKNLLFMHIKLIFSILFLAITHEMAAQESHYHKVLRSQADNDKMGTVASDPNFNGGGVYWSRVRNVDDVAITHETAADSIARREDFKRLCRLAYDAYEGGDAVRTLQYGDSALQKRYHTPDLYFMMAVSFEQLGSYDEADWGYRKALASGYPGALSVYNDFKARQKQRKQEAKQRKKEEKRKAKEEKKGLKND